MKYPRAIAAVILTVLAAAAPARANGVYVGDYSSNSLTEFTTGASGNLTPATGAPTIGTGATGGNAFAVLVSPFANAVYSADGNSKVSVFRMNPDLTLAHDPTTPLVTVGNGTAAMAISPDGAHLYTVGQASNTISRLTIGADGSLSPATGAPTVATGSTPAGIAITPDGHQLYVSNEANSTISHFTVGSDGALTPASGAPTVSTGSSTNPGGLAIAPDGGHLYVALGNGTVARFAIGSSGALSPASSPPTVAAGNDITALAMTADGEHLYTTNFSDADLSKFDVTAGGALSPSTGAPTFATGSGPSAVGILPGGDRMFVTNSGDDTVSMFTLAASGALSPASGAPTVATGASTYPQSIGITPDAGPVAAFTATAGAPGSPTAFDAAASAAGAASISTYTWDFGDGTAGSGPNPAHTYAHAGAYTVTLTLTDADGCSTRGPYTGQASPCQLDPAAAVAHTVTVAPASTTTTTTTTTTTAPATTTPTSTTPAPATLTVFAATGNRQLALTVPRGCVSSRGKLATALTSRTLSRGSGLTFSDARFYLDRGVRHTRRVHKRTVVTYNANAIAHKLPAHESLSLKGLRSGRHTLKVVVGFTSKRTRTVKGHKVVRRVPSRTTLRSPITVC